MNESLFLLSCTTFMNEKNDYNKNKRQNCTFWGLFLNAGVVPKTTGQKACIFLS